MATSTPDPPANPPVKAQAPNPHTYVLDTSVLLADPYAILRFAEHEVVLPVVVITELEGKRHHPELGYFARAALRLLDELRLDHGRLDARCRSATRAEPFESSPTTPTTMCCRQVSGSATTTLGSSRSPATWPPTAER